MTTQPKHTPTPWRYHNVKSGRYSECHYILADAYSTPTVIDGRDQIATCYGLSDETVANAAFIVRACNAHADLLAALNAYTTALAAFAIEQPDMKVGEVLDYLAKRDVPAKAIAAIAKAEGR